MLAGISSSFTSQVASHGIYAVFVLMLIDAVFPAASEIVMLYAGAVAAGVLANVHHVSLFGWNLGSGIDAFVAMALSGTLGYFVGSLLGWAIGRYGGRRLLERRGRWFHLSPEKLDRAERWFVKWGNLGVLVGRVTPVVRSFVSIPAGAFEMPLAPYSLYTFVGSSVWACVIAGFGYGLGSSYERFNHDFRYIEYAVLAGVLLFAAYLLYRWFTAARVRRRANPAD
jgi:membrane protein DedA with SNARE-associated domain